MGRVRWWHAFGPRLAALVAAAVVVSGGAIAYVAIARSQQTLRTQIFTSNMAAADAVAGYTWTLVDQAETAARRFARRPGVLAGLDLLDRAELTDELTEIDDELSLWDSVALTDPKGLVLATSLTDKSRLGASLADTAYVQRAVGRGEPYLDVPSRSRATGNAVATYAVPVVDSNGRLEGVLVAALSLETLSNVVTGIHTSPSARTSLIDRRAGGLIIAHVDPNRILTPVSGANDATRRLLAGERGSMETPNSTGENDLTAFSQTPNLPWGVLILQPAAAAFAPLYELQRSLAVILSIIVAGGVAAAMLVAARMASPLRRLQELVGAFSAGDLSRRAELVRSDEIGQLARSFDQMADQIEAHDMQMRALLADLEHTVANRTADLRDANQALGREKATLDAVMGSMNDGLLVLDDSACITYVNRCASELLRQPAAGLLGKKVPQALDGLGGSLLHAELVQKSWAKAWRLPHEFGVFELPIDGQPTTVLELRVFAVAGGSAGLGILLRDVTAAKELARTKDELVATVSHELRTPLASLLGFTELLMDEHQPPEADRRLYLATMHDDGQRLAQLIDNFLDLQRMETGRVRLELVRVELPDLLRRQVDSYPDGDHHLTLDLPDQLPAVWADEDALRSLLGNLLSNACKYSPAGLDIRVSARAVGDEVEVAVADHGVGIPAETLPKLFDKFYRADNSDRRSTQGAGLGLALSRQLASALGGRIHAESGGLGQGSRFTFTLRLAETAASAATPSS